MGDNRDDHLGCVTFARGNGRGRGSRINNYFSENDNNIGAVSIPDFSKAEANVNEENSANSSTVVHRGTMFKPLEVASANSSVNDPGKIVLGKTFQGFKINNPSEPTTYYTAGIRKPPQELKSEDDIDNQIDVCWSKTISNESIAELDDEYDWGPEMQESNLNIEKLKSDLHALKTKTVPAKVEDDDDDWGVQEVQVPKPNVDIAKLKADLKKSLKKSKTKTVPAKVELMTKPKASEIASVAEGHPPKQYLNSLGFIYYNRNGLVPWTYSQEINLSDEYTAVTPVLALACSIIGVGPLKENAVGRVSIVNEYGYCLFDSFVNPDEKVTDPRTQETCITRLDLLQARSVQVVSKEIAELVKGKTLLGHEIDKSLKLLLLTDHTKIRDTSLYFKRILEKKTPPSLERLIVEFIRIQISPGELTSILEAQIIMKLYLLHRHDWETGSVERLENANIAAEVIKNAIVPIYHISEMNVTPRECDLFVKSENVFVRSNKVLGAYSSTEEYLDIQFRLLREDFLRPLRTAVNFIRNQSATNILLASTSKISKAETIFHDVRISGVGRSSEEMTVKTAHTLKIPIVRNNLKEIDWWDTKMFLTGSLLLLTPDNFKSVKFAEVGRVQEPKKDAVDVSLNVIFETEGPTWKVRENHTFLMMESSVFWGAYKHTLESLQFMALAMFPMKRYIVDVEMEPRPPMYLLQDPEEMIDFSVLMKDEKKGNRHARALDIKSWPSAEELNLDPSQYEAFQKALTQEMTIIQGPPGTGKTFIGIQIVKVLLSNPWMLTSPILIVSYTNHALDQTLEHIFKFITNHMCEGDEKDAQKFVLRIGFGTKSEIIQPLTLRYKEEKSFELGRLRQRLKMSEKVLKALGSSGDIDFESLFLEQGIANFNKLPRGLLHLLSTDGESRIYYEKWKTIMTEANNSPHRWFRLERDETPWKTNIPSKARGYFLLPYSRMKETLEPLMPKVNELIESGRLFTKHMRASTFTGNDLQEDELYVIRWAYYVYLVRSINKQLKEMKATYESTKEELHEMSKYAGSGCSIKDALVIGMTTTAAVKQKEMVITSIKPKIMIVEEAAFVLEAHVVGSLTEHCQQMIMVGDHKQLRALTADNNMAYEHKLDVSLMERLVRNGQKLGKKNWIQLNVQHRMRPEIARMVCPVIYQKLENHPDVIQCPNVGGCAKNIFFVDHQNQETKDGVNGSSISNEYEVKFLSALVKYFVIGEYYKPSQITIIATYLAQKVLLDEEFKEIFTDHPCVTEKVTISTVDGYQGEENDIILLSLVRSNAENFAGFLKTDNRVCVALSRARQGLFMIGNMRCLKDCSRTWSQIYKTLKEMKCIGSRLPLTASFEEIPSDVSSSFSFTQTPGNASEIVSMSSLSEKLNVSSPEFQDNEFEAEKNFEMKIQRLSPESPPSEPVEILNENSKSEQKTPESSLLEDNPLAKSDPVENLGQKWQGEQSTLTSSRKFVIIRSSRPVSVPPSLSKIPESSPNEDKSMEEKILTQKISQEAPSESTPTQSKTFGTINNGNTRGVKIPSILKDRLEMKEKEFESIGKQEIPLKKFGCLHRSTQISLTNSDSGDEENIRPCMKVIRKVLNCGHSQIVRCCRKDDIDYVCGAVVCKMLPCGHEGMGKCDDPPESIKCKTLISHYKGCGHKMRKEMHCFETIDARCESMVEFNFPECEHTQVTMCYEKGKLKKCPLHRRVMFPCGHEQEIDALIPVEDMKDVKCPLMVISHCVHKMKIKCGESCCECYNVETKMSEMRILSPPLVSQDARNLMGVKAELKDSGNNHPSKKSFASGSRPRCKKIFNCGHQCIYFCKGDDNSNHLQYQCPQKCLRKCPRGHSCPGDHKCYLRCEVSIVGCEVKIGISKCNCNSGEKRDVKCKSVLIKKGEKVRKVGFCPVCNCKAVLEF